MPRLRLFTLSVAATLVLIALNGCRTVAVEGPHIRPLDRACLPAGTSPEQEIPLFREDVLVRRAEIATIDSFSTECDNPDAIRAQLEDLECKARLAGADAVIRVRKLNHQLYGFINNPNTPFPSVMQGESKQSFYRGTAIKYQEPVVGEPARVELPPDAPLPAGANRPQQSRNSRFVPIPFSGPTGSGPTIGTQPNSAPVQNTVEGTTGRFR